MLDRAGNTAGDIQIRSNDFAGLPDLMGIRNVSAIHRGTRSADCTAELALLRELCNRLEGELAAEDEFGAALERVIQALQEAVYADELPTLHSRFKGLVADYFHRTGSVLAIHGIANVFRDALLRKALALVEQELAREGNDRPAAASCLLAYGSTGRLEQTLRPGEVRMMSVHEVTKHPQFISSNRHVMQGYVDVLKAEWSPATRKLSGEGFKRPWPPLIRMDPDVRRRVEGWVKG